MSHSHKPTRHHADRVGKRRVGEEGREVCLFDAGDSDEQACKEIRRIRVAFYHGHLGLVWFK